MHPFHILLAAFAVALVVGYGFVLRWERAQYRAMDKAGAWLAVRLSTLIVAPLTAALVIIPARNTPDMAGLAVFYGLLITAAPLFWFGTHWLVGRLTRPRLTFKESARIAVSPLIYAIAAAWLAAMLQPWAWMALRAAGME